MGDLISREELIAKIKPPMDGDHDNKVTLADARKLLLNFANSVPAVDAVKVVRCRDCIFCAFYESNETYHCRSMRGMYRTVEADEFCAWGEALLDE